MDASTAAEVIVASTAVFGIFVSGVGLYTKAAKDAIISTVDARIAQSENTIIAKINTTYVRSDVCAPRMEVMEQHIAADDKSIEELKEGRVYERECRHWLADSVLKLSAETGVPLKEQP